jgi:hypothetical protein
VKIAARLAAEPTWLAAAEAARAAVVSAGHMRTLIRQGAIGAARGDWGAYSVTTDSLAAWLGRRREERGPARSPMDLARDGMARQLEARFPGWNVTHGVCGWKAERPGWEPARMTSSGGLEWILEGLQDQPRFDAAARRPRPHPGSMSA